MKLIAKIDDKYNIMHMYINDKLIFDATIFGPNIYYKLDNYESAYLRGKGFFNIGNERLYISKFIIKNY